MSFETWISEDSLRQAVFALGWKTPTDIQRESIPELLKGSDALLTGVTGSGKTGAFCLPLLSRLKKGNGTLRLLVLVPTRELAQQVAGVLQSLGSQMEPAPRVCVVYGGVGVQPQIEALSKSCDILVATPGRLLDLYKRQAMSLAHIHQLVLDEADTLLASGFADDLARILDLMPTARQSVVCSATLGENVKYLARRVLRNPKVLGRSGMHDIDMHTWRVHPKNKMTLLQYLLGKHSTRRVLVFCDTKYATEQVSKRLRREGFPAAGLHGDLAQTRRNKVMKDFHNEKLHVLVATDLAARGMDFQSVSHVIHYDLPVDGESFLHRNGRAARDFSDERAVAWLFCSGNERERLAQLEASLGHNIAESDDHPDYPRENDVNQVFRKPDKDIIERRKQARQKDADLLLRDAQKRGGRSRRRRNLDDDLIQGKGRMRRPRRLGRGR